SDTPLRLAAKGIRKLVEARAPVLGAVLNQVDLRKKHHYGDYYGGEYSHYGNPGKRLAVMPAQPQRKTPKLVTS
ncbi:MAG TPA: hypothetical protein VM553_14120, partial [Dongiaceae bacterium]|nr:hypothetical protein [Dongiaceae bacterium]